jgi:ADP-ribosylglycohydrolase
MVEAEHAELFIKGAVIGHLIGDALGYPYENADNILQYQIEMVRGHFGELEGAWSMPGAFALVTMASLNEFEGLDLDDLMDKFNDVYIAGYLTSDKECKDLGPITSEAIKNYTNGMPIDRCGIREETTDNECVARILPVGLYFAPSPIDELIDNAHAVCRLTHANALCEVTCAAYCMVIRNLLLQRAEKALELLDDYYRTKKMDDHVKALGTLSEYRDVKNPNGDKHVVDSFWRHPSSLNAVSG